MAHRNEKILRRINEQTGGIITGVDHTKVNDTIGTITHRNGQVGKTKSEFELKIPTVLSVRELQTLAHKLYKEHRLGIKLKDVNCPGEFIISRRTHPAKRQ